MNNGIEGDVQSRMDAFRGNPQALAQRYSQDQQLIDLLALQKLKSEKDAAARQMQMQAGQGQMPTVAQQREQELMGMAKQDVAQRVGAVGQQQAQQQQKNLQQAMQGGIAQAPAPNMMPAQAMASGGIVAFAGPDGSQVKGEMPEWIRNAPEWLKAQWREADATGNVRALQGIKQRAEQLAQTTVAPPVRAPITLAAPAQVPPGVPPGQRPVGAAPIPGGAAPNALPGSPPGEAPGTLPGPPPTRQATAQGIAKALPQAAQGAQPDEMQELRGALGEYLTKGVKEDPEAAAAAERAAYDKQFGPLYQQQRELSQQGIAQLQQRMAQQPKKDPISEFLRGMSSQRTLGMALGAGGAGITAAQRANFDQQALLEDALQKMREEGLSAQVTQETAKRGAGTTAAEKARLRAKEAAAVAGPYTTGMAAADARREIAERDAVIKEHNRKLGLDDATSNMILQRVKAANDSIADLYPNAKFNPTEAAKRDEAMKASERKIYAAFGRTPPETPAPAAGTPTGQKVVPFGQLTQGK